MSPLDVPRARWAAARARSAAVAGGWRAHPVHAMLDAAFDADAARDLPLAMRRARAVLADAGWCRDLLAPLTGALAADPLAEPPLKVHRERGRCGAVLHEAPGARIVATVVDPGDDAPPEHVAVSGQVVVTRYIAAGGAHVLRWALEGVKLHALEPLAIGNGDVLLHDGRTGAHALTGARAPVVTLSAILAAGRAPQLREYGTRDGTPTRAATADEGASRTAMLLTLLRVSGRADARAEFAAATHDPAPSARWHAMREWLALDVRAAAPRLSELRDDPDAEVRAAAAATWPNVRAALCRD